MKTSKLHYLLVTLLLAVTLASCSDDDKYPYWTDVLGSWESVYGVEYGTSYDLYSYDIVRYDFYGNYTGRYTYYDEYYVLRYVDFNWNIYDYTLEINYYDGDWSYLYYDFDNWGYLLLSTDYNFNYYTAYRPVM